MSHACTEWLASSADRPHSLKTRGMRWSHLKTYKAPFWHILYQGFHCTMNFLSRLWISSTHVPGSWMNQWVWKKSPRCRDCKEQQLVNAFNDAWWSCKTVTHHSQSQQITCGTGILHADLYIEITQTNEYGVWRGKEKKLCGCVWAKSCWSLSAFYRSYCSAAGVFNSLVSFM